MVRIFKKGVIDIKRKIFLMILFFLVSIIEINSQIKDNYILINADSKIAEIQGQNISILFEAVILG